MKYKAAVFDLDGTLIDTSERYIVRCVGKTLVGLGVVKDIEDVDSYRVDALKFFHGVSTERGVFIANTWGVNPNDFWSVYKKIDKPTERAAESFAFNDWYVLDELNGRGVGLGVVTDAPDYIVQHTLKLLPIRFGSVVCANEIDVPQKPNPSGLLRCIGELGVSVREALFLGNADADILTAKNAFTRGGIIKRNPNHTCLHTADFEVGNLVEFRDRFFG